MISDEHAPLQEWCTEQLDKQLSEVHGRKRKFEPDSDHDHFAVGAVPGFSTQVHHHSPSHQDVNEVSTAEPNQEFSKDDTPSSQSPNEVHVILAGESIHTIRMHPDCTVGQLAVATDKLVQMPEPIKITTAVGTQLPLSSTVPPGSFVRLQPVGQTTSWRCRSPSGHSPVPKLVDQDRAMLLWQQEGWVAPDEMIFYLNMIQKAHPEVQCHMIDILPELDYHVVFTDILMKAVTYMNSDRLGALAMVIMYNHHWFPMFVTSTEQLNMCASPDEMPMIRELLQKALGDTDFIAFTTDVMPHAFPADCGFQALGWIISKILDEDTRVPWADDQACQWRGRFHEHLKACGKDRELVPVPLRLGGMSVPKQLQQLLESYGVHESRSQECADHLLETLGKPCIASVLKSPKPWADLKTRANMHSPPIRIVLAEELKQAVQKRSQEPKPVGHKSNKRQTKSATAVQVKADQISVPTSVFKQVDGVELGQINMQHVSQTSQGVIVANITEALPYFGLTSPLTAEGLGLLVLDHQDPRLPGKHTIVQVPALCRDTSEPLILTATLFQLGHKEVVRNVPANCLAVQEMDNDVARIMIYKDQYGDQWDAMIHQPVKTILQGEFFAHIKADDVLDVWDRQWMSAKLTKAPLATCEVFSVNLRLVTGVTKRVLEQSGTAGIYSEPRSDDGRSPHPKYQVIWLPNRSFAEATLAQKTTEGECHLVRNQNRYGLRVPSEVAEQVHARHRPEQSFLPGANTIKFRMGPMPYGSTKQSVSNICQKLGWQCRPLGPQGQTPDRSGTYWLIQAAAPPPSWVYHLAHGDVLISQINQPTEKEASKTAPVLASTKTLSSLARSSRPAGSKDDPWLHDDPWKAPKGTKEISVGQIAALEAALEQKLLAKLPDAPSRSDDSTMDDEMDSRVTSLETKLEQLTNSMQTFQTGQQQHNQTMANQMQQLDAKVDHQVQSFHHALDSKLSDQMNRIEALFKKRNLGD